MNYKAEDVRDSWKAPEMNSSRPTALPPMTRRQALVVGASSAFAAGVVLAGPAARADAALVTVPAPTAAWNFDESVAPFASSTAGISALVQGAGSTAARVATPFGGGIQFNGTSDYLRIPTATLGALNVGASTGTVTVAAWVYSTDTNTGFIAGCWQESTTRGARSFGLFNDLPSYGGNDLVCMNVSKSGGASTGYPSSIDYAANSRKITRSTWQFHVGTYDRAQAVAYLNGVADPFPSYTDNKGATYAKNPYAYAAGLNAAPEDFLVGASLKNTTAVNQHRGIIAKLRVWNTALAAEQVSALYTAEKTALDAPVIVVPPVVVPPVATPTVPTAVASWDFAEAASPYASSVAGSPALSLPVGSKARRIATPFGGGIEFNGTSDYLQVPQAQLGRLNVGATTGKVTVAAWVYSTDYNNAMIAGCWQESNGDPRRSYALFNDLPDYGGDDMVCMEVSKLGGPTPGYPFSIDYAAEPRKITRSKWQFYVGTYDGAQAVAYLDGLSTSYPKYTDKQRATYARNPYIYPDGLNATPVDFNVGAVVRDGSLINRHKGRIARLRVWDVALDATQITALYDAEKAVLG